MIKAKSIYNFFLELIFPLQCVNCRKYGDFLCQDCRSKIKKIETFVCPICGKIAKKGEFCQSCRSKSKLTGILIAADYHKGPIKEMVHSFKYERVKEIGEILREMLSSRLSESQFQGDLVIVPVPLHSRKQRVRGFNQAEFLARSVSKKLDIPGGLALKRHINTRSQVELSGRERRKNLEKAFFCQDQGLVAKKTVILIDDVSTTGTTLEECAKVLRTAGARQVWGLVVARG